MSCLLFFEGDSGHPDKIYGMNILIQILNLIFFTVLDVLWNENIKIFKNIRLFLRSFRIFKFILQNNASVYIYIY